MDHRRPSPHLSACQAQRPTTLAWASAEAARAARALRPAPPQHLRLRLRLGHLDAAEVERPRGVLVGALDDEHLGALEDEPEAVVGALASK